MALSGAIFQAKVLETLQVVPPVWLREACTLNPEPNVSKMVTSPPGYPDGDVPRSALSQGSGCRVQVPGFRVQGAGIRVQGAGCRVQGAGFRVQGRRRTATGTSSRTASSSPAAFGVWGLGSGCRVQGSGCRFQGPGFRVQARQVAALPTGALGADPGGGDI